MNSVRSLTNYSPQEFANSEAEPQQDRGRCVSMEHCISNRTVCFHNLMFPLLGLGAGRAANGSSFSIHKFANEI